MKIGIYYFTRTGHCRRIANKIASQLKLSANQIKDDINWKGWRAYFKFQSYAKGKKPIKLDYEGDIHSYDHLIIVSPVWGSRMPPSVKQFADQVSGDKIDLIVSSRMDKMRGTERFHRVIHLRQNDKNNDKIIQDYIDDLAAQTNSLTD